MRRTIFILLICALILLVACGPSASKPGEGVTVRMAQATWDTGWFQAQVFKTLLEELGYEVREPENMGTVAFYFFSANDVVDFWANGWFPLHDRYLEYNQVAGKTEPVGFQVTQGALQGYMIDKATAEEFGITNLGDLANPDIAAIFDNDGDGKADLVGCTAEWGCARVIEHHLDSYDLGSTVTHLQGDYSELMNVTIDRYRDGQPVLFYTWTPNWTVSEMIIDQDIAWLSVPFSTLPDDKFADTSVDELPGCLEAPCDLGFDVSDIRVVANSEFLQENPAAASLFTLTKIPLDDIATQNARMRDGEGSPEDISRHAEEWIAENRDQVDQWLNVARAASE
jgi:glycine betaine/proline transport system substrate-binding protein